MIKATAQLTLADNGRFRPSRPEPKTHAEARDYIDQMAMADMANAVLDGVREEAKDTLAFDNGATDLNDSKGTVVLGPVGASERPHDHLVVQRSVQADTATSQATSFERKTSGTMFYIKPRSNDANEVINDLCESVPADLATPLILKLANIFSPEPTYDVKVENSLSMKASSLLDVKYDEVHQKPRSDRKLEQSMHLQETTPGQFTMDFQFADNLGLVLASRGGGT